MRAAAAPPVWHRFDPAVGAVNQYGGIVHTPAMLRAWPPKWFWTEATLNRLRLERGKLTASERDALEAERVVNTFCSDHPIGGICAVKLHRHAKYLRYLRRPHGWELLGGIAL